MKRAIWAAMAMLAMLVASPGRATAVHVESEGCRNLNDPFWDRFYRVGSVTGLEFFAGETITATATEPAEGGPTTVIIEVANVPVDTAPFPGEVQHTFLTDTSMTVEWSIAPDSARAATWTVSCQAVHAYPLAVSAAQPATEAAAPAVAVAVESGERNAFPVAAVGIAGVAVLAQAGLWVGVTRRRRMAE